MIPVIHGRPEIPSTSPSVPRPPSIITSARAIQNFAIQSSTAGVVSPVGQMIQCPGMIPSSGIENPRQKVVPPNVTVVSQYLRNPYVALIRSNLRWSNPQWSKLCHCLKSRMVSKPYRQYQFPKKTRPKNSSDEIFESCETKTSNTTATRSNLVSLMKTSLRQKH